MNKGKIGRRGLLLLLAGATVGGTKVAAAEAKPVTVPGLAKSLLGLADKAMKATAEDPGMKKALMEAGLIIQKAAADVLRVKVTGHGVRKGEGEDGKRM